MFLLPTINSSNLPSCFSFNSEDITANCKAPFLALTPLAHLSAASLGDCGAKASCSSSTCRCKDITPVLTGLCSISLGEGFSLLIYSLFSGMAFEQPTIPIRKKASGSTSFVVKDIVIDSPHNKITPDDPIPKRDSLFPQKLADSILKTCTLFGLSRLNSRFTMIDVQI